MEMHAEDEFGAQRAQRRWPAPLGGHADHCHSCTRMMRLPKEGLLNFKFLNLAFLLCFAQTLLGQSQGSAPVPPHAQSAEPGKVPSGVILVKGAWSSASDSVTPLPEGGVITNNVYVNEYFGLSYPLPA